MSTETTPLVEAPQPTTSSAGPPSTFLNIQAAIDESTHSRPEDTTTTATAAASNNKNKKKSILQGRGLLLLVAFLYGTLNVTLRWVYALPGPPSASALTTTRGWMAAICFVPFLLLHNSNSNNNNNNNKRRLPPRHLPVQSQESSLSRVSSSSSSSFQSFLWLPKTSRRSLWSVSTELAVWNFGAQGLLTLGLLYISSARASFFTQTSVVMTPVVSFLAGHHVHSTLWVACICALAGLVMLSSSKSDDVNDDNNAANTQQQQQQQHGLFHFGLGDVLCLTGALSWSLYIFRLSHCKHYNEIHMQAAKTFVLAILYSGWYLAAKILVSPHVPLWPGHNHWLAWLLIFYSALGPGTIADVIQQLGQSVVTAAEANIILSLEPVFTAVLGRFLLGEGTCWQEKVGGALILAAALIASSAEDDDE